MGTGGWFLRTVIAMNDTIRIIDFASTLARHFTLLNLAWLKKFFEVEPIDQVMLADPKAYIIDKDGHIFFAEYGGAVVGTFALMKAGEATFELSKMAVDEKYQGLKIGNAMVQAAIDKAKTFGAQKLILFSNTKLQPAIHLYKKYGFTEVPLGASEYKRSNIKMEKVLR
jgi:ribosomal protein S18 acetylase RimI-like enzyme